MSKKRYWLARDGNGMLWLFSQKPTWDAALKEWNSQERVLYLGKTYGFFDWLNPGQAIPLVVDEASLIQGDATC